MNSPSLTADFLCMLLLQMLNGLIWGLLIAIVSIGLSMVYGLIGIINIAHGAFYMLGAFIVWYIAKTTLSLFWPALFIAFLIIMVGGLVLERILLRPVEKEHVLTIIVTLGFMYIIERIVFLIFGGNLYSITEPIHSVLFVLGTGFSVYRIFVGMLSIFIIFSLWLLLQKTRLGLWIRAVKQNPEMALALGIPANKMINLTFGLGAGLAALGGGLAAPIVTVRYEMGATILVEVFIVVIIGGLGKFHGTLLVAVLYGLVKGLSAAFVAPTPASVIALLSMIIILLLRPEGLLK